MGRAPCCDKANVKKGPWSPEEDAKLKSYIEKHGTGGNWIALPQKIGLKRCGKSCRLRWLNYLRPNIKHGGFSEEEDKIILSLYVSIGSRWSIIAAQLPGRTDNDIKNYWNTRLKKKLLGKQRKDHQHVRKGSNLIKHEDSYNNSRLGDPIMPLTSSIANNHQIIPYWPPFSMPNNNTVSLPNYLDQQSDFFANNLNNHASIRKLLMKAGGNVYDGINLQVPFHYTNGYPSTQHANSLRQPVNDSIIDASSLPLGTNPSSEFNIEGVGVGLSMLDERNSTFPPELEELMSSNTKRVDALDFLYGDYGHNNLVNNNDGSTTDTTTTCGESSGWGEMNSLVSLPKLESDCNVLTGGMVEECQYEDNLRYLEDL